LALNDKLLSVGEQCQENINVNIVVSQMADADRCRASLRCIVPNDVAITGIATRRTCVGKIKEQV
jgi:hypothetical protein